MGTLDRLLKLMLNYTSLLDGLSISDLNDVYKYYSAVYLLQSQAQALIDIVIKAAAALGLEVEGYVDAGSKLAMLGILSEDEFSRYRSIVRFRNLVIHQYGIIDVDVIRRIIGNGEYRDTARLGLKIVNELKRRGIDC